MLYGINYNYYNSDPNAIVRQQQNANNAVNTNASNRKDDSEKLQRKGVKQNQQKETQSGSYNDRVDISREGLQLYLAKIS